MITLTVGSNGRQYPDLASAWAAIPTDVVASGNSYTLALYNDSEFVNTGVVTLSGKTTDTSHTITIKPAAGQGYMDNPNVATNRFAYVPANGVAVSGTGTGLLSVTQDNLTITGLQLKHSYGYGSTTVSLSGVNSVVSNCIIEAVSDSAFSAPLSITGSKAFNCLLVARNASSRGFFISGATAVAENLTVIRPSNFTPVANSAIGYDADGGTIRNIAVFGFTQFMASNSPNFQGSNNATDLATIPFGTGNKTALVYANQFVNTVDGTHDFRLKAGADLIDAGTAPSGSNTAAPNGNRQQGSSADIGAWEYASAIVAPTATITAKSINGTTVTISGTTTGSPTSGLASLAVSNVPYNNGVAQAPIALTLGTGTFTATFSAVHIGVYDPTVTVSNGSYANVAATNNIGTVSVDDGISATVTQDPMDGQVLTLHGTYTGSPISGTLTVPAAATNPNGATDQVVTFTPSSGTYTVSATLVPGSYDKARLTLTDANGTTLPQGTTSPVTVVSISGSPQATGTGTVTTPTTHTITLTMVSTTGAAMANLTGLKWAWFDQATPDLMASPTDKGSTGTTNASGVLTLTLTNTTLSSGATGWLVVTDSTGTVSGTYKAFSGPVLVG